MYELKVISNFAAAHKLKMVNEKCENLHGHNWKVEVCIKGESLDKTGILIDFGELKTHVAQIMDQLDHKYLNELEIFQTMNPSSENIAFFISKTLQKIIQNKNIQVSSVTVWESENACATYFTP